METEPGIRQIDGHQIELPGGRNVWVGDFDSSWYINFDDGAGNERKLRISYEAADALVKLLTTKSEEILRFVLTMKNLTEMKWEKFEPELIAAHRDNRGYPSPPTGKGLGPVSDWNKFNDQFRETFDETQDRWSTIRAKRKAEGKCWQCAKLIAVCACPNVKHTPPPVGGSPRE